MLPQSVADVALAYDRSQRLLIDRALEILPLGQPISASGWRDAVADLSGDLLTLQLTAASLADDYLDAILPAQGASTESDAAVNPEAWLDTTDGGGSWLRYLVYAPASVRDTALNAGSSSALAHARMGMVASSIITTGLRDTARSSAQAAMIGRRSVKAYVRMLRAPSCARCAILAGKKSSRQAAFRRHRNCDCVNIPVAESGADFTTDPRDYFDSLEQSEQDRIFTQAGAEAIRRGADIAQVVNARQGIDTVGGQQVTTVGTTSRGLAGSRLNGEPRLLPDEIFLQAERLGWDRAQVLRQLRRFGYLL